MLVCFRYVHFLVHIYGIKERSLYILLFKSNFKGNQLNLLTSRIIWPGNSSKKPLGTKWSSKLKIVLLEEKPFIFKVPKLNSKTCSQLVNNSIDCPWSYSMHVFVIAYLVFRFLKCL